MNENLLFISSELSKYITKLCMYVCVCVFKWIKRELCMLKEVRIIKKKKSGKHAWMSGCENIAALEKNGEKFPQQPYTTYKLFVFLALPVFFPLWDTMR